MSAFAAFHAPEITTRPHSGARPWEALTDAEAARRVVLLWSEGRTMEFFEPAASDEED